MGVIVHDHECVLAGTVDGLDEGPGNIYMNQPPGIGGSVAVVAMRQPAGSVGFKAGRARRRK
eukprot:4874239-Pleurochrysis_carterae.AAC.1